MHVVLSSATEAEMGALFYNAKDAAWLHTTLQDLGNPQPPTPIQTDNACVLPVSLMTQSSNGIPKPLTCAFIGSAIASSSKNSLSIGAVAPTIWLTTLPSITPHPIIASCAPGTCSISIVLPPPLFLWCVLPLVHFWARVC